MAYNTKTGTYLHPGRPPRAAGGIPSLHPRRYLYPAARTCKPGDDMAKPVIGADDHVVEFEITPNRPDCLSASSALPARPAPPSARPETPPRR
ncbi:MAG: hypothetical protein ACLSHO_10970 [Dysosmobacter sp.]